jgi:ABC-type maltose transport system permease subunit
MGKVSSKKRQRLIFYTTAVIFPVAQFIVFWVCVNFNSILLAFRTFDYQTGYDFAGFSNFKKVLDDIIHQPFMAAAFKNTLIVFAIGIVMMFSSIIMSYSALFEDKS